MRIRIIQELLRLFLAAFVVLLISAAALAQSAREEAQRILSKETFTAQRDELARALERMTEEEQIDLFMQLFDLAPIDAIPGRSMSGAAAGALIRRKYDDEAFIDSLAVKVRNKHFHSAYLFQELESRARREDPKHLNAYLRVLRSVRIAAMQQYDQTGSVAELGRMSQAILLESRIEGAASLANAREILRMAPYTSGGWIVLLSHDAVGDDEIEIARTVFLDDTLDDKRWGSSLRFLVAIALLDRMPQAAKFVETTVGAAIEEYGNQTYEELFSRSYLAKHGRGDPEDKGVWSRFLSTDADMLPYLALLHHERADSLIRKCVKVANEMIRDPALYAIVKSRPHLVLEEPPILDDEEALLTLAAAVAVEHPEMVPQLKHRFPSDQLDLEIERVKERYAVGPWMKLPNPVRPGNSK